MKAKKIVSLACAFLLACSACPVSANAAVKDLWIADDEYTSLIVDGNVYVCAYEQSTDSKYYQLVGTDDNYTENDVITTCGHLYAPNIDDETKEIISFEVIGEDPNYTGERDLIFSRIGIYPTVWNGIAIKDIYHLEVDGLFGYLAFQDGVLGYLPYGVDMRDHEDVTSITVPTELNGLPVFWEGPSSIDNVTIDGLTFFPQVSKGKIIGYKLRSIELEDPTITCITVPKEVNGLPVVYDPDVQFFQLDDNPAMTVTIDGLIYRPILYYYRDESRIEVNGYELIGVEDTSITSVTIPAYTNGLEVTCSPCTIHHDYMHQNPFYNCDSLTEILSDNCDLKSIDGVLYASGTLVAYPSAKPDSEFVVPDFVTGVVSCAFSNCKNLESITFPHAVSMFPFRPFDDNASFTVYLYEDDEYLIKSYEDFYENNITFVRLDNESATLDIDNSTVSLASNSPIVKGDATGDGEVSISDVVLANRVVLGKEKVTDSQYTALDIDSDGNVSATDALSIMNCVVGLIDNL
ncbi:MAG: hypothetical protein K2G88_02555 [Oscillospiraceae bacterium]|nr:hypothetical protein [Oscillospiraceae bacterium]